MSEGDLIAVPHLRRLWARCKAGTKAGGEDWAADQAVIYGLGLGLRETLFALHSSKGAFSDFERWILGVNGGMISPDRVDTVNRAVQRIFDGTAAAPLGPSFEPVFGPEDLRFWDENGYVVLRGALPPSTTAAAAGAIWDFLGMDPAKPDGWYDLSRCEGIMVPMVHHPAFESVRRSERIRRAFAQLWQTEELYVSIGFGGFNPPEKPGWRFSGQGLHWDISLVPPIPVRLQGLVYLTDTPPEQGAFRCVPGFHRRIGDWLAGLAPSMQPNAADLTGQAVPVAGQAGDLVIWQAALPHCAGVNRGLSPRLVQYLTWWPFGFADRRDWG